MRIAVTGATGFIGTELVAQLAQNAKYEVHALDKRSERFFPLSSYDFGSQISTSTNFHKIDLCNRDAISKFFQQVKPDWIFHLAADSHVDTSIQTPLSCITNNIISSTQLFDAATEYLSCINACKKKQFGIIYVSTDEVFGSLKSNELPADEQKRFKTSSPYSASKAAGNHIAQAWRKTYCLPIITTQCTNNYGPGQHPEKLIPHMILKAISGEPLPLYGNGQQIRDWIHVSDHCKALIQLMESGIKKGSFNIGASCEMKNIDIAKRICSLLDEFLPKNTGSYSDQITFVTDRPGHDNRYGLNWKKINTATGWRPIISMNNGLKHSVKWYLNNQKQMRNVVA